MRVEYYKQNTFQEIAERKEAQPEAVPKMKVMGTEVLQHGERFSVSRADVDIALPSDYGGSPYQNLNHFSNFDPLLNQENPSPCDFKIEHQTNCPDR